MNLFGFRFWVKSKVFDLPVDPRLHPQLWVGAGARSRAAAAPHQKEAVGMVQVHPTRREPC